MAQDEGIYEVEDLLDHRVVDGMDYYLVKWKGYGDTSWEPDGNIGTELGQLKAMARRRAQDGPDRKRRMEKKDKKKDKKKRRRDASDDDRKRKSSSDSDSSGEQPGLPGMPGMMPGMMPPGMPPMMPGMMPGMSPDMMMPGMMDGKGKGMVPGMPPMMMKGGFGGPPMMGKGGPGMPPPFGFDPGCKGGMMPPMGPGPMCFKGKGKGKPFGPGGPRPFPETGANREALDMQRFAVERKRKLREFAGSLHLALSKGLEVPEEKMQQTKEFQEALGLQLEGHQLPVLSPSEVVIADALWLTWLLDSKEQSGESAENETETLLKNIAKLARVNQTRTRQLLIKACTDLFPTSSCTPTARSVRLFNAILDHLPKIQSAATDANGAGPGGGSTHPPGSPEYWRDLVTQIYNVHNPSKLADVEALLAKYRGRERTLYLGICEKYKVAPNFGMAQPGMPGAPGMPGQASGPPVGWPGPPGAPPVPPPPPGAPAPPSADQVAKYKEWICDIYKEHNPDKLKDVDTLLGKYKGREELVYRGICTKYGIEPKSLDAAVTPAAGATATAEKKGTSSVEKYKQLISEVYAEHNKEKLGEIDEILKKYQGKEKTLYLAVCKKYNIEPKDDKKAKKKKEEDKVALVKPLICEVYQEHNPAKLENVDELLAKYKGREEQLYLGVCEKYGVESKLPKPDPASTTQADPSAQGDKETAATAPPASGESPAVPETKPSEDAPQGGAAAAVRQAYAELIRDLYTEHNPSKLDSVDQLLNKYVGQEQDLYLTICRKYNVKPKDPLGLGSLEWLADAERSLPVVLERLLSTLVLHGAGMTKEDGEQLAEWEEARHQPPPRQLSHRFELVGVVPTKVERLVGELQGSDGSRWKRLEEKCKGCELSMPCNEAGFQTLTVTSNSAGKRGREPFDCGVSTFTDALASGVKDSVESDEEGTQPERWMLPWVAEEVSYIIEQPADENGDKSTRREIGIEYKRGCWQPRRRQRLLSHASHHTLIGPDVEARVPGLWKELADKLWSGMATLKWGAGMPADAVVTVEARGGHESAAPNADMPSGCSAESPGVWVVITAISEEELETARNAAAPVLQQALGELSINGLFAQSSLFVPQHRQIVARRGGGDGGSSSSSDCPSDDESDAIMSDAEPAEDYRPLRLTRAQVRDAYLQGLLCLNCDAADHKHQDCPFRKRVCWNCHSSHPGTDCPIRCRFCKERHDHPLLECVKKVCRRVNDWKKSKPSQEQRSVLSNFEQLMIKLEGFEDLELAKHNVEVQQLVKLLAENNALFPGELNDLARSILNMQPPKKKEMEPSIPPPPAGAPPKPYVAPRLPKESPPPLPEGKYPWSEKIFLDSLLTKGMYGSNVLSRIIGRGGANHRRMETESGARVFFRGLGVSGREMHLNDPMDCRLHISVKGDVPAQGQTVRRIVKEIISDLDNEINERCEMGPLLDRPRDVDRHPFGFLLAKGNTNSEYDEPLKFRFPEEDGQTLNDLLVWLKQAKLPLELDSDTQWRTTLQITPSEAAPPDDAPAEAEAVVEAFNKVLAEWHYPCPYWFEEQDLRPTGLWTSLAADDEAEAGGEEFCTIALQQGQGVRLSALAVAHFAAMLEQAKVVDVSRATAIDVLARLRGVVRRAADDQQLLLYLKYPWAFFAESMGRGLTLPFTREQTHTMLVELGRVGGRPTERDAAPPFRGFIVEWMPLKGAQGADAEKKPAAAAPEAAEGLMIAERPAAKVTRTLAPMTADSPPRGVCKYWLPDLIFSSAQDLSELMAGPQGSHFGHVLKKYPNVDLFCEGTGSLAVPPAHRLHVCMVSEDSEIFEAAAADVLDLVETVCDMVGEELGMTEEQVEGLIREIRPEKYFEAHGIRTPLAPTKPAAAPAIEATPAPPAVPVPTSAPDTKAAGDFEFVDDDVDMNEPAALDGDATEDEDDARTEASDLLSEISDEGPAAGGQPQLSFDDI